MSDLIWSPPEGRFRVLPYPKILRGAPPALRFLLLAAVLSFGITASGNEGSAPAANDGSGAFLDSLEQSGIHYFVKAADPKTGLVSDRAFSEGGVSSPVASVAATGFGLTALCVGVQHGWLTRQAASDQALRTLRTLLYDVPTEHGYYYHFIDKTNGHRAWQSEVSSIDTALLMAGVLTARRFFDDPQITACATQIYDRVDWPWMLNGKDMLSLGWSPEKGFIQERWSDYCELMILYLLGIGSPTHPLDAACWRAWKREPVLDYKGKHFIASPPLFTHQYSEAWFDFRGQADGYADYWVNSLLATQANREFCMEYRAKCPTYSDTMWGASASDCKGGYGAWGGPPQSGMAPDGTVVPCAVAGSLPFDAANCLLTLRHMRDAYGSKVWGQYGFVDAFNPMTGWKAADVLGIDVGISVIMAENSRTGGVWKWFMSNPEAQLAMKRAGFAPSPLPMTSRSSLIIRLADAQSAHPGVLAMGH